MLHIFEKKDTSKEKPPYLERIDELTHVDIVRLKGNIDLEMVPIIDSRIQENRRKGGHIEKNIILDFAKVQHIDTATLAFHIIRIREYQKEGKKICFINVTPAMETLFKIFHQENFFKIFKTEQEAIKELDQ